MLSSKLFQHIKHELRSFHLQQPKEHIFVTAIVTCYLWRFMLLILVWMFQGQMLNVKSEDYIGFQLTIEVDIDDLKCNTYVALLTEM